MATHRQKMTWWADYRCNTDDLVSLTVLGRYPVKVQAPLRNATYAFDAVLRATGYENPCDYTGSYMCRNIAGTNIPSLHAYGIAIDLDYGGDTDGDGDPTIDRNPHIHRPIVPGDPGFGVEWQILEHQVRAVESIVNAAGVPIWKWLGWSIGDTMHFEADVPPEWCQPHQEGDPVEYRGVLNVPDADWARTVVDWGIEAGIIVTGDNFVDDWDREEMNDGRLWTFLSRFDAYLDQKWS